jgi:hypothetical protein
MRRPDLSVRFRDGYIGPSKSSEPQEPKARTGLALSPGVGNSIRDPLANGAVPMSARWAKVNANGTPQNAVLASGVAGLVLTLPALYKSPTGAPTAFLAVVSIGVIGLYLAFAIPIWYRWKAGDAWQPGPWTLGAKYKWMCLLAVGEVAVTSVYFVLPFGPASTPWDSAFTWTAVNYAPIVMVVLLGGLYIGWHASAKHWFTGPKMTVAAPPPEPSTV